MKGAGSEFATGVLLGVVLYAAFQVLAWLVDTGTGFYFRALEWLETRRAKEGAE